MSGIRRAQSSRVTTGWVELADSRKRSDRYWQSSLSPSDEGTPKSALRRLPSAPSRNADQLPGAPLITTRRPKTLNRYCGIVSAAFGNLPFPARLDTRAPGLVTANPKSSAAAQPSAAWTYSKLEV